MRYPEKSPLPVPLPPERRTVGQVIAEAIKLYRARFWRMLPLGAPAVPFALAEHFYGTGQGGNGFPTAAHMALLVAIEAPLFAAAYVGASLLVLGRASRSRVARAYVLGVVVFAIFRLGVFIVIVPGVVALGLLSLAVPALLAEGIPEGAALRRSVVLVRADPVHALGGLVAVIAVTFIAASTLFILLHTQAANSSLAAAATAYWVVFPLLFAGSALLYVDQEARLRLRAERPVIA